MAPIITMSSMLQKISSYPFSLDDAHSNVTCIWNQKIDASQIRPLPDLYITSSLGYPASRSQIAPHVVCKSVFASLLLFILYRTKPKSVSHLIRADVWR